MGMLSTTVDEGPAGSSSLGSGVVDIADAFNHHGEGRVYEGVVRG